METTIKRLCLDCNRLLQGRADKKFCDDHCRSNYHNRIRAEDNSNVRAINLILKRNRDVLARFNLAGKTKVSATKLEAAGFDPGYHTHTSLSQQGQLYIFCYEQGYQKLGSDEFLLICESY